MENENEILKSLSRLDSLCASGYAIALHIRFTTPRFLFQTYSKEWMEMYSEKGFVLKDPTVLWGFSNTGAVKWSDLQEIDESGILPLAKEFGLNFGFTFAVDVNASRSIASFARDDREFDDTEIQEISEVIQRMHMLTSNIDGFSTNEVQQLKEMSVEFTHG